jgi:hypothetical protein
VPGVGKPLAPVNSQAHPASCSTRPYSNLNKRRVHASPHLLVASGSAGEPQCAVTTAAARRRQHVAHVYVMIYKPAAHGHCRFVKRSGRLTRPRSCRRPIEFRAVGRARWHVRLRIHLAPGVYLVRSDAVDGNPRHQRRTGASVKRVRVRGIVRARHASAASRPATDTARPATATALRPNFLG